MVHTGVVEINTRCSDVAFQSCSSELFVDNEFQGYTPIQFFKSVGKHDYQIIKQGYTSVHNSSPLLMTGTIDVKDESKNSYDIEMINVSMTGGVSINSSPEGAKILIDDKELDKITPTMVSGLSPGEHRYKIMLSGYETIEDTFTAVLGKPVHIEHNLIQLKDFGTLYIYPTPILYGIIIPYILHGAKIYVDNVYTGKNIPSPVTGLTKGVHTFRVEKHGTIDREGMFIINGEDTIIINVYPILQPKIGMLVLHTSPFIGDPKIARVYIDGKDTGEYNDIRQALPEGTHTYRLHIEGFEDPEGSFDIVANRITRITPHLCHLGTPRRGMLNIESNPSGALVSVDGIYMGQYTPTQVKHLLDGDYTYRLSKSGYSDNTGTLTITNSNVIDLNPSLVQKDTILDISCNVIAAIVYIDNHTEEQTTPTEIIGLQPGTHTYRLIIPKTYGGGFDDATGTFNIEKGKTTKIDAILNLRKDKVLGNLSVNSVPIGAKVCIDDVDTGSITPHNIIEVNSGIHKIKLTLPGYKDWIGTVNIIQASIVSITENLTPEQ